MLIAGISASPRKGKYTEFAVKKALAAAKSVDSTIETVFISLAENTVKPCTACGYCYNNFTCAVKDDDFNMLAEILKRPDLGGIILGSPVYMGGMSSQAKAFIDRSVMFRRNGFHFRDIAGGAVSVGGSRNGGQEIVIQNIHAAFLIHDMIVAGDGGTTSHFGGAGWERSPEGIEDDEVSNSTIENLGSRVAALAMALKKK